MTAVQMGLTIAVCTAATMLTRFLPFLIFSSKEQQPPEVVRYLGRVLPAAIFGMLIVYCLKGVTLFSGSHGIPEALALLATIALHKWKHQTLLIMTTQVTYEGSDVGVYEVGKRVRNRFRFLEAHDMTIEAVVTKSMWLLAQNCESFDQLQQRFYRQVNFDTFYH